MVISQEVYLGFSSRLIYSVNDQSLQEEGTVPNAEYNT